MSVNICPICGGKTKGKFVELTELINGKLVMISNVEAEVCLQCDERVYSENEMKKIDELIKKVKKGMVKPSAKREMEVYSF